MESLEEQQAVSEFDRMVKTYGWRTPSGDMTPAEIKAAKKKKKIKKMVKQARKINHK